MERNEEPSTKRKKLESDSPPAIGSASVSTEKQQPQPQHRKKRKICDRCHRPVPQTCLCDSLPTSPISLSTTEVIVLQHPLELKNHKAASHRSLPLLELCLDSSSLILKTGRRFGKDSLGDDIISKLWVGSDETIRYLPVLVFPKISVESALDGSVQKNHNQGDSSRDKCSNNEQPRYSEDESTVLSLAELVERWKQETNEASGKQVKILLLVLDATWKHAREMHLANIKAEQYPSHMLRLALQPNDFDGGFVSGRFRLRGKASRTGYKQQQSSGRKRNRRDKNNEDTSEIDESWMSTAECIAWILSKLEDNRYQETIVDASSPTGLSLYEILMKPLDAMVAKWNSFRTKSKGDKSERQKS